ncbi:energy-coupled thiamine transporter ThiT [Alkalicoccus luteus]|uniref:Energy-coupled thiamine transporter ThiT n=1 Tax=Alkalicoccus luteus TaxID=1237094 RepID=A0A969PLH9_9BACI|nr:energy-coupled thiamine transporter ThiT [Alkalicoccus luteus]NJP36401.1 energy-coupled thiamine transporter ThiT [Alkalicoccus luteus]
MRSSKVIIMIETALMAALALILSFITIFTMPFGGSVNLAMLPIVLLSFRRGPAAGIMCGFLFGLLNLITGPYVVHWSQALLEYPVAFALVGTAAFFTAWLGGKQAIGAVAAGIIIAVLLRFAAHFSAGVIWFGEFAPEGTPVAWYSFLYNLGYLGPSLLLILLVTIFLLKKGGRILEPEGRIT